jgi:hypothetical protein
MTGMYRKIDIHVQSVQMHISRENKGTGCRCTYFGNIPLALFPVKKCKSSMIVV